MSRGGGGSGSSSPEGPSREGGGDAWRRTYDRLQGLLPRVEELAADRARLEAANRAHHEAREKSVHARLLQAEASRERWKAAYIELPLLGNPKIAELQESDLVDSRSCEPPFHVDNSQLMIKSKEAANSVETSQENVDHGGIARDFREELRKLKQAYKTLCSNKDKEISAVNDFLLNQLRRMDKDYAGLLKIKEGEAAQPNEAAKKLRQNVEELQVAVRNRDAEIGILRAEAGLLKIKVVEAAEANDAAQKFQQNVEELQVAVRNRDAEIGILRAEAEFLKIKEVEAAQANDAAEKLQQNLEVPQVSVRNMDDKNARLRTEAVNAQKRVLVLEGKLLEFGNAFLD